MDVNRAVQSTANAGNGSLIDTLTEQGNRIASYLAGDILLDTVVLSLGSTDTNIASAGFDYVIGGTKATKAAVAAGTAPSGADVPAGRWGSFTLSVASGGTITVTASPGNAAGFATERSAQHGYAAVPAGGLLIGHVTVQADEGSVFDPGSDALAGGSTGNPAAVTNYYGAEGKPLFLVGYQGRGVVPL